MQVKTINPVLVLAGLMVIMSGVWFTLQGQSLRLDESQSLWQVDHSTFYMLDLISRDVHVPLYHLLLKGWQQVFGTGIVSGRALSLLFSLLSLPVLYLLARKVGGVKAGMYAVIFAGLSPFLHWYSSELRMYTLLFFLATINSYAFLKYWEGKSWGWYILVLLSAVLGVYTHYFFWLILLGQGIYLFITALPGSRLGRLGAHLMLGVWCLIAFLPWVYLVALKNRVGESSPNLSPPSAVDIFNTFAQFVTGFQSVDINSLILALWPLVMVLLFAGFIGKSKNETNNLLYPFLILVSTFVVSVAVSYFLQPLYSSRYLIVALPSFLVITGWLAARLPSRIQTGLIASFTLSLILFSCFQIYNPRTPVKEDFAAAAKYLDAKSRPSDIIYITAPFVVYPMEYYYQGASRLSTIPNWNRFEIDKIPTFKTENLSQQIESDSETHASAWLVAAYDQGYQSDVVSYLESRFTLLEKINFSSEVELYKFDFRPARP